MNISIGSYSFRLEIVILIVVLAWIMFGHILCSCCTMTVMEGMETVAGKDVVKKVEKKIEEVAKKADKMMADKVGKENMVNLEKKVKEKMTNLKKNVKEGFAGANETGAQFASNDNSGYIMNPDTWSDPTLTYSPGQAPNAAIEKIWERKGNPATTLASGELDMFANTQFKPECCPSAFSSSTGCACLSVDQYNYLKNRGTNNTPYSEY